MLKFEQKEIFISNDIHKFITAVQVLDEKNIPYKTKVINSGIKNRITGDMIGTLGENPDSSSLYYIYTDKKHYEYAIKAINNSNQ